MFLPLRELEREVARGLEDYNSEIRLALFMRTSLHSVQIGVALSIGLMLCQSAIAESPEKPPSRGQLSSEEVVANLVRKNLERASALHAYQGTRVYHLDYRGFPGSRSAEITVDVKYQAPDTKQFSIRSQAGSHLLIDRVFEKLMQSEREALTPENQSRVALNTQNYRFALVGFESTADSSAYVLSVEPVTNNKLLYRGRIWVDATDFAVTRIDAVPAKNPSFWTKETRIEQVYKKIGDFWLPVSNRSTSTIRLGGHANLTIDYIDYQITAATPPKHQDLIGGHQP